MAQTSGFFNSLIVEGQYDRKYNANDYSDNLAVIIGNGVLRSENDDLKVTASGLIPKVAAGRGWIEGHYFHNNAQYSFPAVTAPTGGNRYDRIMLRLNNNVLVRSISLVYVEGTAASTPTKPEPVREDDIYDLVLADIYVAANATGLVITDTRADTDVCGWVYSVSGDDSFFQSLDNSFRQWFEGAKDTLSSVTLFKKYTQQQTLEEAGSTVSFNIPQYDADTCFIEVYVNGIFDTNYTLNGTVLTFTGTLNAGAVVTVNCYKSIDGTGIMTVADEITELQQQFATLDGISDYTYQCTGVDDNISLSQIAQAFLNGSYTASSVTTAARSFLSAIGRNSYLAAFPTDGQITIKVVGTLGATTPFAGNGTAESRYRWFSLGNANSPEKKITFDFENCPQIRITCGAATKNIIFYGTDLNIKNANVYATGANANTDIYMCIGSSNYGLMNFDNCRFKIVTAGIAIISENGTFTNCILHCKSAAGNAYCIDAKAASLVRLIGGTFYAYTGTASGTSAIINVASTETTAVVNALNISCPTQAQTSYRQAYLAITNAGMTQIDGAITILSPSGSASCRNIINTIARSKR